MIRFRSFRATLLTVILGSIAVTQIATFTIVAAISQREARREIELDHQAAAEAFSRVTSDRVHHLAVSATAVASDYAFKESFFNLLDDPPTLHTIFTSASNRIGADLNAWVDLDGNTIASQPTADSEVFAGLVARADESVDTRATGYLEHNGQLYVVAAVPIRAPVVVAWWVVGMRVDTVLAGILREMTGIEVSFANSRRQIVASSLHPVRQEALAESLPDLDAGSDGIHQLRLHNEETLVSLRPVRLESGGHLLTILQYSLDEKLAPARRLSRIILLISIGGMALATVLGAGLARRLSQPVQDLAEHTRVIAAGDYSTRLELDRRDELGDLARAFNAMSSGLAERDQVRDLLDKNVSPEVAAQLMREGAALGGEEREVTILFADLRGFTSFAERLAAREVVAQLNRYLDRMSRAIEAEGGVIDKFIGDEIMALFGAPVSAADSAERAIRAALAMRRALAQLNTEFAADGLPELGFGVGINTAHVIAGNIGSTRRLNYSVIGDGVNLAARLQSLTRRDEFGADLIFSESTLAAVGQAKLPPIRDLGSTLVKGRREAVRIYTVDA